MAKHTDTSRPVDAMPWRGTPLPNLRTTVPVQRDITPTVPLPRVATPRYVDAWSGHADTDRYWR